MSDLTDHRRILCVDDEPNVLSALERNLFDQFDVTTATSGAAGLELIRTDGAFAVIVSDMQMPMMNGAAFLTEARKLSPDSVRILLTGHADIQAAILAVNQGSIFRFLVKPCPQELLTQSLNDAVAQYRLVIAERELLEKTLAGAAKVFMEILSLVSPTAFSRANFVKRYVLHLSEALGLKEKWQYELSANLSQIGCITVPPDLLEKAYAGQALSDDEQKIIDSIPQAGSNLLSSIPRFEPIAEIIRRQKEPCPAVEIKDGVGIGAAMLKIALDVDRIVASGGISIKDAVDSLRSSDGLYNDKLLDIMANLQVNARAEVIIKVVLIKNLSPNMVLEEDVLSKDGAVLVGKGREVNFALRERLENFSRRIGVKEPIRVRIG